jgi:hypothetical protein
MANLQDNPFADPFSDPSIRQATATNSTTEEYNPFAQQPQAPAANAPTSTTINMSSDELFRQQEELRKREQDLQRRQQEFERRQTQPGGTARSQNPHNWPPLPSFIPVEPCFYQDIDVEIPSQFQETVRLVYYVFLVYIFALTINLVASLFYFIFAGGNLGILFLSIIQLVLFTPCSFLFWFRPVYKAFRDDSSFNFMVFFFILFFHAIFCLIQALGLSSYACGWSNALSIIGTHIFIGILMLFSAVAFSLAFVGMVISLLKVHRLYRGAGFSIEKARKEFSDGVMSDRNVQAATRSAASSAASFAAQNATNSFGSGRY